MFVSVQGAEMNDKVILNTNETLTGKIISQNEKVVLITTEEGRFQFPLVDVKTIIQDGKIVYPPTTAIAKSTENTESDERKITLNTGEIIIGNILVENEQVVMIKTREGGRFQFPRSEIKSIDDVTENDRQITQLDESESFNENNKFRLMGDLKFGLAHAGKAYGWVPEMQVSLLFGGADLFLPNSFLGIGIGYNPIFASDYGTGKAINFLPIFMRFQSSFTDKNFKPYVEVDAGYSVALSDEFGGGFIVNASIGVSKKLNERNSFQLGIFGGFQSFSADLTEEKDFGIFTYYGKTVAQHFGIKASITF
ncbi:hypothetical protein LJB95_01985 [Paludibacteraceae bacterium OttesenSCG-928-F17]|nr:hypothetical protein [Paludibacteraceae bacterium OttesenSCG-928-F17]